MHELQVVMPTLEEYFYAITDGLDHKAEFESAGSELDSPKSGDSELGDSELGDPGPSSSKPGHDEVAQ